MEGVKERLPSGQLGTVSWTHLREVQESLLEMQVLFSLSSKHTKSESLVGAQESEF